MGPAFVANLDKVVGPGAGAMAGIVLALILWLVARSNRKAALLLRFLTGVAMTWSAVCVAYIVAAPTDAFGEFLLTGTLATEVIAACGAILYIVSVFVFEPGDRQWRRSSALLAGVTLMGSAFIRATYQPSVATHIQPPLAVLFIATVWRFRAEPLVYLSILGVAAAVVFGSRHVLGMSGGSDMALEWGASMSAGVSLLMVLIAAGLGLKKRREFNIKWYRQGLLIVPLVVASLAAMVAGFAAVWNGPTWHTAWVLGSWWAVLLVSSLGLKQPDLFGFSMIGAALAASAAFAALGGSAIAGFWGRYSTILLVLALGAALLAGLLSLGSRKESSKAYARGLYLAAAVVALAALAVEPLEMKTRYLGIDFLIAAGVMALAYAHGAPAWVSYLVAALITAGGGTLLRVGPDALPEAAHHRFIQVAGVSAVAWLALALLLREILKRVSSDRAARRYSEPFTVFGMVTTLVLAVYLGMQQVRAYSEFLTDRRSETLALLGPLWGLMGWLAVLLAFLLSMWLFRHTARTFLFYVFGILATAYTGLFGHPKDLYGFLIYCIAGYGSSHLLVYFYEAKFMAFLSRASALYRDERRASTTIFTLAFISCLVAAVLAIFRLSTTPALIMLGVMSLVFLVWSFVWLRGEMLYPAVFMLTLFVLAIWHNVVKPTLWTPDRLYINAWVMIGSAWVWLVIGNQLHPIRGEIFQLAGPARHCSVVLGLIGTAFAAALAISPTFPAEIWRMERTPDDWATALVMLLALIGYFAWARRSFERRFFSLMGGLAFLLLGLYVGIYTGLRITNHLP